MAEASIEFAVGALSFSGHGEESWLAAQLEKVLAAAPDLIGLEAEGEYVPSNGGQDVGEGNNGGGGFTTTLAKHLKDKGGETNQTVRFLATADWLRRRGDKELTTAKVTKALKNNQQKRLGNPADCLNKNVSKGFCEKTHKGFFLTPDGLKELGY
jgi:hypothetical protein